MTWQYNPERGDITDPDAEELEEGCYMMRGSTPDGLCPSKSRCPGCEQKRRRAYYGGALIAETVRSTHGPLLAAAPKLLAACKLALNAFESNWCIDWDEVRQAIEEAEPKPKDPPMFTRCAQCGAEIKPSTHNWCDSCIPF
jgi:hypothetical protein